jgi:hypothetical protein
MLTAANYRVILDKNDGNAGIDLVRDNGTIDAANSFPFASEYWGGLFCLHQNMRNCDGIMTFGTED